MYSFLLSFLRSGRNLGWLCGSLALTLSLGAVRAETAASPVGSVEGRVLNLSSGDYVGRARITIPGLAAEVFTDSFGFYRLPALPAGEWRLVVSYSGLPTREVNVVVSPGQVTIRNVSLSGDPKAPEHKEDAETIVLDAVVIATSKETNASAIAINEQRYAPNFVSVLSTEQFGNVPDGNAGEFVKFLPGVSVDYTGGEVSGVAVGGMPTTATPIFMNGSPISGSGVGMSRGMGIGFSINNMARIEVSKSPTPDVSAAAIGGSLNLVQKSAFERAKPVLELRTYLTARSDELTFAKTPGPNQGYARKIAPAFEFNYIKPVNARFGFSLGGLHTKSFTNQNNFTQTWLPASGGFPSSFFPTTPPENPYATQFTIYDAPKVQNKDSIGGTADWKPYQEGVLSLGLQYSFSNADVHQRYWVVATNGAPSAASFGPTFTYGRAGLGASQQLSISINQMVTNVMPTLRFRHNGPLWKVEAAASLSNSKTLYRDTEKGFFNRGDFRRTGLTVNLIGVTPQAIPSAYEAFAANGAKYDITTMENMWLNSASSNPQKAKNTVKNAFGNVTRLFQLGVPIKVKTGFDITEVMRDRYTPTLTWTFLGPDRQAGSDTGAGGVDNYLGRAYLDQAFSQRTLPFNGGRVQWWDEYKVYQTFRDHPEWWTVSNLANNYLSIANNSQRIQETVAAGYVRSDLKLLRGRWLVVAGLRWEKTTDEGYGNLVDLNAKYQKQADGTLLDGNPNVAGIQPVLLANWNNLSALEQNQLLYRERGAHVRKSYRDYYPSVNASCNITEKLIGRLSYAATLARPDFNNIVPGINVTEPTVAQPLITVSNPGLIPWTANNWAAGLEYYLDAPSSGVVAVRGFRREIKNFFSTARFPTHQVADLLAGYGLDPADYPTYQVSTSINVGDALVTGGEVEYRQTLGFLPAWARGLSFFANGTLQHLDAPSFVSFRNFPKRNGSWGVTLARPRFTVSANWNYRGRQRADLLTGNGVAPETYIWQPARLYLDLSFDLRLTRQLSFYGYARNATNVKEITERFSPETPAYARTYSVQDFGAYYTLGLKMTF